ncbi:MAG TPA: hypothetical protein V6C97_12150 [Oculatellaceae cyanobacterium]
MKHVRQTQIKQAYQRGGQSLVEVTSGLVLIFAVVLALADLGAVIYACALNDTACRNAANAAAAGSPGEANYRAQLIISRANAGGFNSSFADFELVPPVKTDITAQPLLRVDPETHQTFSPGGLVSGNVEVTTQVEVKPFVLGAILKGRVPLTFRSTQSCPIRYMEPAGATSRSRR